MKERDQNRLHKELLQRNEWEAIRALQDEEAEVLELVVQSEQFGSWPSAKRQQVLSALVELEKVPPKEYHKQLADMGLFISGLHTIA